MNNINTLPPFKRFCVTIGNLPSSYVDSMSYYECLMWLCKYLKDTVIPAVNENAEAVNELINWFNNLDVQDEIDKKLDEMVEDGTLQEIITEYLQINGVLAFDTVSDMVDATNIINGSICKTLGFHSIGDGGSSLYKIRTLQENEIPDNMETIELNNNLIAQLILTNSVNPEIFGAYGDDTHDDTLPIQKCFDTNSKEVNLSKNYYITQSIIFKGSYRKLSGCGNIRNTSNNPSLIINGNNLDIELGQIWSPNCIRITANGSNYTWCQYITIKNADLIGTNICVECERDYTKWINEIKFENVRFSGKYGVVCDGNSTNQFSYGGFKFIDCGNESCTECFIKGYTINDINITNIRNNEAWEYDFIDIENECNYFSIETSSLINLEKLKFNRSIDTTNATKGIIIGNVVDSGGSRISSIAKCYNGMFKVDTDNYEVLDGSHLSYNYTTASSNILKNTYITRSAGGGTTYVLTLPKRYFEENEFYIINQNPSNKLELHYGSIVRTISLNSTTVTFKLKEMLGAPLLEEMTTRLYES